MATENYHAVFEASYSIVDCCAIDTKYLLKWLVNSIPINSSLSTSIEAAARESLWPTFAMSIPQGSHSQTINNIASQQHAISPRRVLLIFSNLFIEGIWCWKLNSRTFYFNYSSPRCLADGTIKALQCLNFLHLSRWLIAT